MNGMIDYIKLDVNGTPTIVFPRTVTNAIYIGNNTSGKTLDSFIDRHQHNMADIVDLNVDSSGHVVFNTLTLLLNGNVSATYNGVEPISLDISLEKLGAASNTHNHDTVYSKLTHTHNNYAAISHTHSMSDITDFSGGGVGEIKPLTIQIDGFNQVRFDGSAEQTLNLTIDKLGAASKDHVHDIAAISGFQNLQITLQNGSALTYSPKAAASLTITAESVGAAASNHNHDNTYASYGHNHDDIYAGRTHQHPIYATVTALEDVKKSAADGKSLVASAVSALGVNTAANATFDIISANIRSVRTEKILFHVGTWYNEFASTGWNTFKGLYTNSSIINVTNFNNWIKFTACRSTVAIDVTGYDYIEICKQTWNMEELLYLAVVPESDALPSDERANFLDRFKIPVYSVSFAPKFTGDNDATNGKDIARINVKNITGRCYLFMEAFNWTGCTNIGLAGLSKFALNGLDDNISDSAIEYIYKISLVKHAYFT